MRDSKGGPDRTGAPRAPVGRAARLATTAAAIASLLAPAAHAQVTPPLDVWILDIGQGACIVVDCPNPEAAILVDCGTDRPSRRIAAEKVGAWVNAKLATKSFNSLVISHAHTDHYRMLSGGIVKPALFDQATLGGLRSHYADANPRKPKHWLDNFLVKIGGPKDPVHAYAAKAFIANDTSFRCAPATVDVLTASVSQASPASAFQSRENANSVVLRIAYGGRAIVLPGDAESITQQSALDNAEANELSLAEPTVVVGAHHGSRTHGSNDETWRDAWKAPVAVFSAEVDHGHGHPVCTRLTEYGEHTTPTSAPFELTCGNGQNTHLTVQVQGRLLETYDNGHVLVRFTPSGMTVLCQIETPACDGVLSKSLLPKP